MVHSLKDIMRWISSMKPIRIKECFDRTFELFIFRVKVKCNRFSAFRLQRLLPNKEKWRLGWLSISALNISLSCAQFEQKINRNQPWFAPILNSDFDFVKSIISYILWLKQMRYWDYEEGARDVNNIWVTVVIYLWTYFVFYL